MLLIKFRRNGVFPQIIKWKSEVFETGRSSSRCIMSVCVTRLNLNASTLLVIHVRQFALLFLPPFQWIPDTRWPVAPLVQVTESGHNSGDFEPLTFGPCIWWHATDFGVGKFSQSMSYYMLVLAPEVALLYDADIIHCKHLQGAQMLFSVQMGESISRK